VAGWTGIPEVRRGRLDGQVQRGGVGHRRIAQPQVGAALGRHAQDGIGRAGHALPAHADPHALAVDGDAAEVGIVLLQRGLEAGRLQRHALGRVELELGLVEVVARGHVPLQLQLALADAAGAGAEGLVGLQQIVGGGGCRGTGTGRAACGLGRQRGRADQQRRQRGLQQGRKEGPGRDHVQACLSR
jgi:hypothetical protein